jgi:hypothetical protein
LREEEFDLPVNRQLAIGRLMSAVSRLSGKPELMEKNYKVLADQLNQGIIEKGGYILVDLVYHIFYITARINQLLLHRKTPQNSG